MNTAARVALYGVGAAAVLAGAYGLVSAVAAGGGAGMHGHDATEASGHDHAADGGPAPVGMVAAADPTYPVGTRVRVLVGHMPGMAGADATISGAFETTAYSVSYTPVMGGDPVEDHRWVVHEELRDPGTAPLPVGAEVVLEADHMAGMRGATATIDSATSETVYMVDLEMGGMLMSDHKWVVESELEPAR